MTPSLLIRIVRLPLLHQELGKRGKKGIVGHTEKKTMLGQRRCLIKPDGSPRRVTILIEVGTDAGRKIGMVRTVQGRTETGGEPGIRATAGRETDDDVVTAGIGKDAGTDTGARTEKMIEIGSGTGIEGGAGVAVGIRVEGRRKVDGGTEVTALKPMRSQATIVQTAGTNQAAREDAESAAPALRDTATTEQTVSNEAESGAAVGTVTGTAVTVATGEKVMITAGGNIANTLTDHLTLAARGEEVRWTGLGNLKVRINPLAAVAPSPKARGRSALGLPPQTVMVMWTGGTTAEICLSTPAASVHVKTGRGRASVAVRRLATGTSLVPDQGGAAFLTPFLH